MSARKPAGGAAPRKARGAGKALDVLKSAPEALQAVFENSPEIVMIVDRERRIQYVNRYVPPFEPNRVLGVDAALFVSPEHRPAMTAAVERTFREGAPDHYEVEGPGPEGTLVAYESRVVPIVRDGAVAAAIIHSSDVTERRRAERTQRATFRISAAAHTTPTLGELYEAIHRIVGELMPARNFYIALVDAQTGLISFPYFVDEYDPPFPPKEPGRGATEYVLRSGQSLLLTPERAEDLTRRGEVELIGAPSIDWLGVPLTIRGTPIGALVVQSYVEHVRYGEAEQRILEFVSSQVAMAIEHKRAEEALRRSERQFRTLVESAHDVIFAFSPEGRFTALNPAFEAITGLSREEWLGRPFVELVHPDDLLIGIDAFARVLRQEQGVYAHMRIRSRDGGYLVGEIHADAHVVDGRVVGALGIAHDVTERERLEEQLRQAQKMEAVGRLAGGVAHDFNNLLTAIGGYSDLLLADLAPADPRRADVDEIKKASVRAAGLTRQLLAFSRRQVLQPKVLDLNAVIAGAEKLLRRLIGEHIRLDTRLAADLGAVRADAGQIEQVVMNLAVNARDAMPTGGTLLLATHNVVMDAAKRSREQAPMPLGPYVALVVSDTGTGMDEDTQRHLFEPFFTTREKGKGTGLGLATVYGIVKQSGGFVWVDSAPGRGATFTIHLPLVDEPVQPAEPARPARADLTGTETILVVEDEPAVRTVARESLRAQGYRVFEAGDGDAALRVAAEADREIDLLLTDVVMPGMGGGVLAGRLAASRPGLRVLYMSGYTDDALGQHGVLEPGLHYLQKPFAPDVLARKVREVLDGES